MTLEPELFPIRTLRRRAKLVVPKPTESFKEKTVLITGATGTICSGIAKILIELDVKRLIFGVRNVEKGTQVAKNLKSGLKDGEGQEIIVWALDLESYASVHEFARRISAIDRLDNVVMGAAVCTVEHKVSPEGWNHGKMRQAKAELA